VSTVAADISIDDLLASLGLTGDTASDARRSLEAEGVTNPRKQRIAVAKTERAREVIDLRWQRLCHNCRPRAAHDGRPVAEVPRAACSMCGGSNNARAVNGMTEACRATGVTKLLVVGGSPSVRRELLDLVAGRLELRLVEGDRSSSKQVAKDNVAWADLIVVLGATQLAHKVSNLYTGDQAARRKLVTTSRRGIQAIADDVTRSDRVSVRDATGYAGR
jgi:hypothetical protein